LPDAVRSFYAEINGYENAGPDLFEFWPLNMLGTIASVVTPFQGIPNYAQIAQILPEANNYVAFAEVMIWSHVLAVRVGPRATESEVVWLCGPSWARVARSFDEFWELYIDHPNRVLFAHGAVIRTPDGNVAG
jgi:hypothetical protein